MYHEHFGFFTTPFSQSPHLQFLFRSSAFEETMAHLVYGLEGGEDIILITGEIGTGKTLALYNLAQHITKTYRTALINVTQLDFRELLKMLLVELDVQMPPTADRADLLTALKAEIVATLHRGQRLLLIIDEAQNLDGATLEGVRLLTNLGSPEEQALQVVLSGQPGLRTKINAPELAQIRQRIRVHYHLDRLGPRETTEYIEHRVRVAGCDRPVFRRDAIERIYRLSDGIPRLVNMVADRALLAAYVDGADQVRPEHVEEDGSLARSPVEETVIAAVSAQASESPPPALDEMPEPEIKPESEPEPETEPESELEPVSEPEPDEIVDTEDGEPEVPEVNPPEGTASEDEASAADHTDDEPTEVVLPAGVEFFASGEDPDEDPGEDEDADEDADEGRDDPDTPPPMAVPRRANGARRLLITALLVTVIAVIAMALVGHYRGLFTLPLLPPPGAGEATVVDEAPQADRHRPGGPDAVPGDTLGAVLADTLAAADTLVVAEAEEETGPGVVRAWPDLDGGDDSAEAADHDVVEPEPLAPATREPLVSESDTTGQAAETVELPVPLPGLYVHVGSFRELARAEVFCGQCERAGLSPHIVKAMIDDALWYRVHVGPFSELTDAQQAQTTAKTAGLTAWSMIVRLP